MKYFLSAILSAVILIGGIYTGEYMVSKTTSFGSFTPVQASTFTLAGAGITNTQTTVQLASFALPDPNKTPITMSMFGSIGYGVIEPQTSRIENISFTGVTQNGNGSATLTGVTRGISFYSPFVSISANMLSHAGGSNFILSNSAAFYGQFAFPNNPQTWTATQTYGSTTPPIYDADPVWANFSTQVLADVSYVNSVVAAGAANASETVKGIIQLSTGAQSAAGTSLGSTGARLVVPNSLATSTPYSGTPQGSFPTSNAIGGKISQLWIDLTQPFVWSGLATFTAGFIDTASSTLNNTVNITCSAGKTLNLNGVSYVCPSTQGAAGTFLKNDGSGNLNWLPTQVSTFTINYAANIAFGDSSSTIATIVLPANTLAANKNINIQTITNETIGGGCSIAINYGNGSATTTIGYMKQSLGNGFNAPGVMSTTIYGLTATTQAEYMPLSNWGPTNFSTTTFTGVNIANQSYLSYVTTSNSNTCTLNGYSLTLQSN